MPVAVVSSAAVPSRRSAVSPKKRPSKNTITITTVTITTTKVTITITITITTTITTTIDDDDDDDVRDLDETGPYGPGSAEPLEDGSAPEGYDIKGNEDSMLYHVPGSRYYGATKAEVYFAAVEDAESAGFAAPGGGRPERYRRRRRRRRG